MTVLCPFCGPVESCCFTASRFCIVCGTSIDDRRKDAKLCGSQRCYESQKDKERKKNQDRVRHQARQFAIRNAVPRFCIVCGGNINHRPRKAKFCGMITCYNLYYKPQKDKNRDRNRDEVNNNERVRYQVRKLEKLGERFCLFCRSDIRDRRANAIICGSPICYKTYLQQIKLKYRLDDPEGFRDKKRQYFLDNQERIEAYQRQYRPDYYINNRETILDKSQQNHKKKQIAKAILNDPELKALLGDDKISPRVILEILRQEGIEIPLPKERKT